MFENQIGAIIRLNRIQQNMSIRALAEAVGIEYSQLSKIERGLEFSNKLTIESIFDALDIDYQVTIDYIPICAHKVERLYHDMLYRKQKKTITDQLDDINSATHTNGISTPVLMINLIYAILYTETDFPYESLLSILKKVEDSMTSFQKQLFYQYSGFYHYLKRDIEQALNYLEIAETLYINDSSTAMIAYQKGIIYSYRGETFEAYEHLNKAKYIFEQHHNYIRSIICSVSLANVFLLVERFDKAMEMYQELLNIYDGLLMDIEDVAMICSSMLLGALMVNDFNQFFKVEKKFDKEVIDYLNHNINYIFYRIIALYQTKQYKECLLYIERFEAFNLNLPRNHLIEYYKLKINAASQKRLYGTLKLNLKSLDKRHDYNFVKLVLKLIIKEYEASKDYETLYQYAMKLSQLKW